MKILTCNQLKEADQYTIEHDEIQSIDLMERAAEKITDRICSYWDNSHNMVIFAGPGNNGGDAVAVARMLYQRDYNVYVYLFNVTGKLSEDCIINIQRLGECGFTNYVEVVNSVNFQKLTPNDVVIDGLFGTGINKPLSKGFAMVANMINSSGANVVSIDIPSGLMGEDNSFNIRQNIVKADLTLSIQLPKLSFLFPENADIIGKVEVLDIGINKAFIQDTPSYYFIIEEKEIKQLIKPRQKFAHKGKFGHGLLIAGSYGMGGAAVLSALGCVKSGIGLLTVHTPVCNHNLLQSEVPVAKVQDDVDERYFSGPIDTDSYQAIGIGPGLGQEDITVEGTLDLISDSNIPLVIDADALNILSSYRDYMNNIPRFSIITPHIKEFERIVGKCSNHYERISKAKDIAARYQIYIILKGAWSAIITPEGNVFFNPNGNPGMATGGSGDVLTGILTALLCQGYSSETACKLGTYVHGLAGDMARDTQGEISMTATDIIDALPKAWKHLSK